MFNQTLSHIFAKARAEIFTRTHPVDLKKLRFCPFKSPATGLTWLPEQEGGHPLINPEGEREGKIQPTIDGYCLELWLASTITTTTACLSDYIDDLKTRGPVCFCKMRLDGWGITLHVSTKMIGLKPYILVDTYVNLGYRPCLFDTFFMAVRPYNHRGLIPIHNAYYLSSGAFVINNRLGPVFSTDPSNVLCLSYDQQREEKCVTWEMILNANCPNGLVTALAGFKLPTEEDGRKKIHQACLIPVHSPLILPRGQKVLSESAQQSLLDHITELKKEML